MHNIFLILIIIALLFVIWKLNNDKKHISNYLNSITNAVNSIRYGNLSTKVKAHSNYKNITDSINRMIETLNDRENMIIEYQNELMKRNKLLETGINSLSDGILLIDSNSNILKTTPKINEWFNEQKLLEKNIFDFIELSKDITMLDNDEVKLKNSSRDFLISSKKLNDNCFMLIIKDITKEKEIENLKESFVATLTHDLKVPIIAESNMLGFLLDGKFGEINEKQRTALLNMENSNKELINLVQVLLETYKIKETGVSLLKEDFELNSFIKNVINEMGSVEINFTPCEELVINADRQELTRVLKNIISNALLHGNTTDKIDVVTKNKDKFATISVVDYGEGISAEELPKIFDKYYSSKFKKIGTGLGLYLAKEIITSHGGKIEVTSEPNVRTEFCIKLPL